MSKDKLWGGRFTQPTDKFVEEFTASIQFDKRLYHQDIRGSIAHARMLGKQEIIPMEDVERIVSAICEAAFAHHAKLAGTSACGGGKSGSSRETVCGDHSAMFSAASRDARPPETSAFVTSQNSAEPGRAPFA